MKNLFITIALLLAINPLFSASTMSNQTNKVNAKLEKGALVCRSKKSLTYLLQSQKNYQKVVNGLASNSIYKNCFLSIMAAGVTVDAHYSSDNLIKNYYVINKHTGKTRYVPIEFIQPINTANKSKTKRYKKRNKTYHNTRKKKYNKKLKYTHAKIKKSSKLKKYNKNKKSKISYQTKSTHVNIKNNYVSRKARTIVTPKVKYKEEHKSDLRKIVATYLKTVNNESNNKVGVKKDNTAYKKVYRCSAVSFDESFKGEHKDKEKSKNIALKNCKKYQKDEAICVFENCFILRVNLD